MMNTIENRQIAIVVYPGMTALDALGPYEILKLLPGVEIRFVWHEPGPIVTDHNILVIGATHSFDETPNPWMVLVPGSEAQTVTAMADKRLLAWLQQVDKSTTWTTSVCSGALVLAAAGILKGHPATTHWIAQSGLKAFGVESRPHDRIVRSGKIWTAAGVSAGLDLALHIAVESWDGETAAVTQLLIEYDPQPPLNSGHPDKADRQVFDRARKEMLRAAKNPRDLISVPKILWQTALRRLEKST